MKRFNILALEEDDIQVNAGGDADVDTDSIIEQGQQAEVEVVSDIATLEEHMEAVTDALEVQQEVSDQVAKNEEMLENVSQVTPESVAVAQEEFYKSLSKLGQIPSLINISRELAEPLPLTRLRLTVEDQKGIIGTIIEKIKAFLKAIKDFFVKIFQKLGLIRKAQEEKHNRATSRLVKNLENFSLARKGEYFTIPYEEQLDVLNNFVKALGGYILAFDNWGQIFKFVSGKIDYIPKPDLLPYEFDLSSAAGSNDIKLLEAVKASIKNEDVINTDQFIMEEVKKSYLRRKKGKDRLRVLVNFKYIYSVLIQLDDSRPCGISYLFSKIENEEVFQTAAKISITARSDCLRELDDCLKYIGGLDNLTKRKNIIVSGIDKVIKESNETFKRTINLLDRDLDKATEKWQTDLIQQLLTATKNYEAEYAKHIAMNSELELLTRLYNVISSTLEKYGNK